MFESFSNLGMLATSTTISSMCILKYEKQWNKFARFGSVLFIFIHLAVVLVQTIYRSCFSEHFSRVLKKFPCAYKTQKCTQHVFYSFIIVSILNSSLWYLELPIAC